MGSLLTHRESGARRFRSLLDGPDLILAPGAYDCLSARLIEATGFRAVYMTGFGTAAAHLGRPDVGLLGMTEMVDNAARIVRAVDVPVIADADTGYGNHLNVIRTIREFEAAGVAAVHIEDQVAPKKCGHMEDKRLVPQEEMVAKIRAAVAARTAPEFTVIARTDAAAVEGIGRALDRAESYRRAGADMLFIEAPETESDVEAVARRLRGCPLVFNWAEGGKTPAVPLPRLRELGFRLVIFPLSTLLVATRAMRDVLTTISRDGTPQAGLERMVPFKEFVDFIGLPEIRDLDATFGNELRRQESELTASVPKAVGGVS